LKKECLNTYEYSKNEVYTKYLTHPLLSDLNKNTKSVSSVIAWVPAYSRKVKLVFDNRLDNKVILSTDLSMNE